LEETGTLKPIQGPPARILVSVVHLHPASFPPVSKPVAGAAPFWKKLGTPVPDTGGKLIGDEGQFMPTVTG